MSNIFSFNWLPGIFNSVLTRLFQVASIPIIFISIYNNETKLFLTLGRNEIFCCLLLLNLRIFFSVLGTVDMIAPVYCVLIVFKKASIKTTITR